MTKATASDSQQTQLGSDIQEVSDLQVADLKTQLEKGLKARFPRDFALIELVVTMVENNQLPRSLVQSTFEWARRRASGKKYPIVYFERALRDRAAKMGIQIPSV